MIRNNACIYTYKVIYMFRINLGHLKYINYYIIYVARILNYITIFNTIITITINI